MEELIRKVVEAFRDYVVNSPEVTELIEKAVKRTIAETDWESIIAVNISWEGHDSLKKAIEVISAEHADDDFDSRVRSVVSDMRFTTEARSY